MGLSGLLSVSCQKEEESKEVFLRVKNTSSYQFDSVYVATPGGTHHYGSLRAGQNSAYSAFTEAYSYAYVRVVVNGQRLVWQPIDYVDPTPLQSGNYTYEVNVTDLATSQLSISLAKP
ncbi:MULTISPECIES: hypothetical protein [Hymenobacter]|nr:MULTISPECIES: hypothetical protein [Hymenobacter]MBB4600413.1 hypothetical protein [Hymenobacter latericoloratus]